MARLSHWMVLGAFVASPAWAQDLGASVWMARCKGCHGVDGRAQTPIGVKEKMADFSSAAWQRMFADPDIRQVIVDGSASNPKMKPFGDRLSDAEVSALVRYIRSLAR